MRKASLFLIDPDLYILIIIVQTISNYYKMVCLLPGLTHTAFIRPFPLTVVITSFGRLAFSSDLSFSPITAAFSITPSSFRTFSVSIATFAASGFPPNVDPWLPGVITFMTSSDARTAEI